MHPAADAECSTVCARASPVFVPKVSAGCSVKNDGVTGEPSGASQVHYHLAEQCTPGQRS